MLVASHALHKVSMGRDTHVFASKCKIEWSPKPEIRAVYFAFSFIHHKVRCCCSFSPFAVVELYKRCHQARRCSVIPHTPYDKRRGPINKCIYTNNIRVTCSEFEEINPRRAPFATCLRFSAIGWFGEYSTTQYVHINKLCGFTGGGRRRLFFYCPDDLIRL